MQGGISEPPRPRGCRDSVRGLVSSPGAQALASLQSNPSSRGQVLSANSTRSKVISPPLLAIAVLQNKTRLIRERDKVSSGGLAFMAAADRKGKMWGPPEPPMSPRMGAHLLLGREALALPPPSKRQLVFLLSKNVRGVSVPFPRFAGIKSFLKSFSLTLESSWMNPVTYCSLSHQHPVSQTWSRPSHFQALFSQAPCLACPFRPPRLSKSPLCQGLHQAQALHGGSRPQCSPVPKAEAPEI